MRSLEYVNGLVTAIRDIGTRDWDNVSESHLSSFLNEHLPDFIQVFTLGTRSAQSRQKLEGGKIEIDAVECEVNKPFIEESLRLSDALEQDELFCAELLYAGTENVLRYDRTAIQSARYLYHYTREAILEATHSLILYVTDETLKEDVRHVLQSFLDKLITDRDQFVSSCFVTMERCRTQSKACQEHDERAALVGSFDESQDSDFIQASLMAEHEKLSIILALLCKTKFCPGLKVDRAFEYVKSQKLCSIHVSHYVLIILHYIQSINLMTDSFTAPQTDSVLSAHDAVSAYKLLHSSLKTDNSSWHCSALKSIFQIVFASELNSFCKDNEVGANSFDYEVDVLDIARAAVEARVFQHLNTFLLFQTDQTQLTHPCQVFFDPEAFSFYEPTAFSTASSSTRHYFVEVLKAFVRALITNLADILKEAKLQEEDFLLSEEIDQAQAENSVTYSVELFFGLIHSLYLGNPDSALEFWDDTDSDLFGFLIWGSHCQAPSMIYAYFMMLGALSAGEKSSSHSLLFCTQNESHGDTRTSVRRSVGVTWSFLFDSLRYYVRLLQQKQGNTKTGSNVHEILEIDAQNTLVLKSYLFSISTTVKNLPDVSVLNDIQARYDCTTVLFQLLSCRLSANLFADILTTLAAFARTREFQARIWNSLEPWLKSMEPQPREQSMSLVASNRRKNNSVNRIIESLSSFSGSSHQLTTATLTLLTALITADDAPLGSLTFPEAFGESYRKPGINDYTDFIIDTLVTYKSSSDNDHAQLLERIAVYNECLTYMSIALESLDLDLVKLAQKDTTIDSSLDCSSLNTYLTLAPGSRVMFRLLEEKPLAVVFSIIKGHDTEDPLLQKNIEDCVLQALKICLGLAKRQAIFLEFVLPLLERPKIQQVPQDWISVYFNQIELLVHTCLLCTNRNKETVSTAFSLIFLLIEGQQSERSYHLASVMSSVDESKNILHSFMTVMDSEVFEIDDRNESEKSKLLRLCLEDIKSHEKPCVGLFILGFRILSSQEVSLGIDSGEIGSGTSLFHSILHNLITDREIEASSTDIGSLNPGSLLNTSLMMQIVLTLVENPITANLIMPILRGRDFLEVHCQMEPVIESFSNYQVPEPQTTTHLLALFFTRRSALLAYVAKELHKCQADDQLFLKLKYIEALLQRQTTATEQSSGARLSDFLDILQFDHESMVIPNPVYKSFDVSLCNHFVENSRRVGLYDIELVMKAVDLKFQTVKLVPLEEQKLRKFEKLQLMHQLAQYNAKIQSQHSFLNCLQSWCILMDMVIDVLERENSIKQATSFKVDLLQILTPNLSRAQESFPDVADVLSQSMAAIMARLDLNMVPIEVHLPLLRTCLVGAQNPTATYIQREFLYVTCIHYMNSLLKHSNGATDWVQQCTKAVKIGSDRLFSILCQDAIVSEGVLHLSACVLLDLIAELCERSGSPIFLESLSRHNLFQRFLSYHISQSYSLTSIQSEDMFTQELSLVLRMSRTRDGAKEVMKSGIFAKAKENGLCIFDALAEDSVEDLRFRYSTALIQLTISCSIALGPHNETIRKHLKAFVDENLDHFIRRRKKSKNDDVDEFDVLINLLHDLSGR